MVRLVEFFTILVLCSSTQVPTIAWAYPLSVSPLSTHPVGSSSQWSRVPIVSWTSHSSMTSLNSSTQGDFQANDDDDDDEKVSPSSSTIIGNEDTSSVSVSSSTIQSPSTTTEERSKLRRQEAPKLTSREMMAALGTSPRRIVLSVLSASGIALAGNFLGVTSRLLTTIPEDTVEASGLDTYFPRGDFKRVRGNGYTCTIPKEWVADTFIELAKAQRQARPLDYSMSGRRSSSGGPPSTPMTLPDSAFGPPGRLNSKGVSEQGDTNVSVILSSGLTSFVSLQKTLGTPQSAAETLLRVSLAPEGSGRVATLVENSAVHDLERDVYQFEYTIDRSQLGRQTLRAISIIGAGRENGNTLYTLTVVAPLVDWESNQEYASKLRRIASSFHLTK